MTEQEIRSAFAEIKELRDKASEKEKEVIIRLEEEGLLSQADAIFLSLGIVSFGGRDNGGMLEALVLAATQGSNQSGLKVHKNK